MADGLNLSLPPPPTPPPGRRGAGLLALLLAVQILTLAAVLWRSAGRASTVASGGGPGLDEDAWRRLALKLEQQGLADAAAAAWESYLATRGADAAKAADIWYRIGCIRQDAGQYEAALAAFYRSESFAKLPRLEAEVGRRVQECLERLGRFAALRHELRERTTLGAPETAAENVVAEIGPTKVTMADIDRLIEGMVERQLAHFEATLPLDEVKRRKEEILRQAADHDTRRQVLMQYLSEEVLYRQARQSGLAEDAKVRANLLQAERAILAQEAMAREIAAKIVITPTDVDTYFEAHKDRWRLPRRAEVAHILLGDEERARAAIEACQGGQSFESLASTLSTDRASAARGGKLDGLVAAGRDELPGAGPVAGLGAAVFAAAAGAVLPEPLQSAGGWHAIKVLRHLPEEQRRLEDVRDEVQRLLRTEKERDVQERFIRSLFESQNVVVHNRLPGPPPAAQPGSAPAPGGTPTP